MYLSNSRDFDVPFFEHRIDGNDIFTKNITRERRKKKKLRRVTKIEKIGNRNISLDLSQKYVPIVLRVYRTSEAATGTRADAKTSANSSNNRS